MSISGFFKKWAKWAALPTSPAYTAPPDRYQRKIAARTRGGSKPLLTGRRKYGLAERQARKRSTAFARLNSGMKR